MNDHVSLREFIERIIAENNLRRDDLRLEDNRRVDERFTALDKALILQSASYPTTRDFNELKTHVDSEYGIRTAIAIIASGLAIIVSVIVALLMYLK